MNTLSDVGAKEIDKKIICCSFQNVLAIMNLKRPERKTALILINVNRGGQKGTCHIPQYNLQRET